MNNNSNEDEEIISWFEDIAFKAACVQTQTLHRILEQNFGVEYLKKWLGNLKIQDIEPCALESLYTSLVPLVSHADLEPYIQRIADGDPSPLLTQEPITTLSLRLSVTSASSLTAQNPINKRQMHLIFFFFICGHGARKHPLRNLMGISPKCSSFFFFFFNYPMFTICWY